MDPLSLLWSRLRPDQEGDRRTTPPAREIARSRPGDARRSAPPRTGRTAPSRVPAATGNRLSEPRSAAAEERRRWARTSASATSGCPAANPTELSTAAKDGRGKIPASAASWPRSRRRRRSGTGDSHSATAAERAASRAEAATAAGSAGRRRRTRVGRSAEGRRDGAQAFQAPSSSRRGGWDRRLRSGQSATAKLIRASTRPLRLPNSGE